MDKYNETLNYIHSLSMRSNPPHKDLKKIKYLCGIFGNPQDSYGTVHIAGTNGKGSISAMLFNIIKELGYKAGRYISPFIENFTERISVGENDISEEEIVYYAERIRKTLEQNNIAPEYAPNEFEFITLMAFLYYREKGCETAVIETGLGGRLDPTNAVKSPLASVITSVSLDHTQILGDTVEKIAVEKCGIIKSNSPVVLYPLNGESVTKTVGNTARERNSRLIIPDVKSLKILDENIDFTRFEYKGKIYKTVLAGRHQAYNAVTAIETAELLYNSGADIYEAVSAGIEKTSFPSRFEILSKTPLIILDGAHNISGITALKETIRNLLPDRKIILVCGMMKDKNPRELIKHIAGEDFAERFIGVPVNSYRAEDPQILCKIAEKYCKSCEYCSDMNELEYLFNTFSSLDERFAAVCFGSLYLSADIKRICKASINKKIIDKI